MLMSNQQKIWMFISSCPTYILFYKFYVFLAMSWLDSILHYCIHPSFSFKDTQTCIIIKITRNKINATYPHLKSFLFSIFCYHWNNISLQFSNIALDHPSFIPYFLSFFHVFFSTLCIHIVIKRQTRKAYKPTHSHNQVNSSQSSPKLE